MTIRAVQIMTSDGQKKLRLRIQELLQASNVLTLATLNASDGSPVIQPVVLQPWAADLFFASDQTLSLYFISSPDSQHSQNLEGQDEVAVTVRGDSSDWFSIRGLQISGHAAAIAEQQRPAVLELYLNKFSALKAIYQQPASADEEKIRLRLIDSRFYCIKPHWVRLIDNGQGFAAKQELTFDSLGPQK